MLETGIYKEDAVDEFSTDAARIFMELGLPRRVGLRIIFPSLK